MDIQRTIIYMGLFIVGLMLWTEWQKYEEEVIVNNVKQIVTDNRTPIPAIAKVKSEHKKQNIPSSIKATYKVIEVVTDLLSLKISTQDGSIKQLTLLKHFTDADKKEALKILRHNNQDIYLASFGILDGQDTSDIEFFAEKTKYQLAENQEELIVVMHGINKNKLKVSREFKFTRGKHVIEVNTTVDNQSQQPWQGKLYYQLTRTEPAKASSGFAIGMNSYLGAAISDKKTKVYQKLPFSDFAKKPLDRPVESGWVAMQEHYFLSAFIPKEGTLNTFYSQVSSDQQYSIGYITQDINLAPRQQRTSFSSLYVGPEYSEELSELSPGLELTIDYGWLWFISTFLFASLKFIYEYTGNWGWSIIMLTIMIKLVFYRLSSASYKSMANMKKFQPKLQAIKEKYQDDKPKLNQAIMDIYRKEKINPLGGCLPIVIQIPVFIALYWVLLESVELRHAPFTLWINDLSSKDPYFVLPILMGLSMFLQQRLSPPAADPIQAKVMSFLPIVFTILFISVPAGLVLYWTVNNLLSIMQQWYITRSMEQKQNS